MSYLKGKDEEKRCINYDVWVTIYVRACQRAALIESFFSLALSVEDDLKRGEFYHTYTSRLVGRTNEMDEDRPKPSKN